jgi:hypothetical protein
MTKKKKKNDVSAMVMMDKSIYELGLIMGQYRRKSDLSNSVLGESIANRNLG